MSEILTALAGDESRQRISVGDLTEAMNLRAYGALMFIFAVPNALPTPPGTSTVLGAPLLFLAAQLLAGKEVPWLPRLISARSVSRADFAAVVSRAAPVLSRAERLLRPRLAFLTRPPFEQLVGLACLCLALILVLPIPLGNMAPAVAICIFSLALMERDGLAAGVGFAVGTASVAVASGVVYVMVKSAIFLVTEFLTRIT